MRREDSQMIARHGLDLELIRQVRPYGSRIIREFRAESRPSRTLSCLSKTGVDTGTTPDKRACARVRSPGERGVDRRLIKAAHAARKVQSTFTGVP